MVGVPEDEVFKRMDKVTNAISERHKVYEINNELAFACAGNLSIETVIIIKINKQPDELVEIIDKFYKDLVEKQCNTIFFVPVLLHDRRNRKRWRTSFD